MKKYSRTSHGRHKLARGNIGQTHDQSQPEQIDIYVRGLDRSCTVIGADGDQQNNFNIIPSSQNSNMVETQNQIQLNRRNIDRLDERLLSPSCDSADLYSLIGPGALQSLSNSTQCDIASLDYADIGQPISLPLNCVWGNGMQFQPTITMPTTCPQFPAPSAAARAAISLPLVTVPPQGFNSYLPFPDKSGNVNSVSYSLLPQGSMMSPPAPTLNASLGYPTVYVSPAGLITVLLKYDVAIEMTVDKNIRVVNHRHKSVAASNNRGSINCIYHVAAKIYQESTKVEVEVFGERRARMQTDGILFASASEVYLLDENHIVPSQFIFNNMSKDSSVNVLFAQGQNFTNELLIQCDSITKSSKYYFHKDGSTTIIINGVKITQDENGEVAVISGPRFISASPIYGSIYLQTHFVEMSVQVCNRLFNNCLNQFRPLTCRFLISDLFSKMAFI